MNERINVMAQLRTTYCPPECLAAVAELIEAANKVQTQVAPLLESNGYISVGAMDKLRRALDRVGAP